MKLKVMIADDDEASALALQIMLKRYFANECEVMSVTSTVKETLAFLKERSPDLVFLDIELPDGSGFDVLERASKKIKQFVFTTAHSIYAIQAIKHEAMDYLLKPVSLDDLKGVITKAQKKLKRNQKGAEPSSGKSIPVPTAEGHCFINKQDILYIKAEGRYSLLFCVNGENYMVCKNIGEYEQDLNGDFFFRIHRSYLVNCNHVTRINNRDGGFIEMNNHAEIEISKRKKSEFIRFLQ